MIYPPGTTGVSIDVQIVDDVGLPVTGLTASTFPTVRYALSGPNTTGTLALSDLAAITSSFTAGGIKERAGGFYRLDTSPAMLATAGVLRIFGESTGKHLIASQIEIGYVPSDMSRILGNDLTNSNSLAAAFSAYFDVGTPLPSNWTVALDAALSINAYTTIVHLDGTFESDGAGGYRFTSASLVNAPAAPTAAAIDAVLSASHGSGSWVASTGTGSRVVTITVNDGTTVIQGAVVRIYLNASDNQVATTSSSGIVSFSSCADGTYTVAISYPGYTFTPTTLSVTANTSHTYSMTARSGSSSDPSRAYGELLVYDAAGVLAPGETVVATPRSVPFGSVGLALNDGGDTVTADSNGVAAFPSLFPGVTYSFVYGDGRRFTTTIPAATGGTTVSLNSIIGH